MNSPDMGLSRAAPPDPDKGKPVARRGRKAKGLTQTAWLPKVKAMKRFVATVALVIAIVVASAVPALAAVRVSARAKAQINAGHPAKIVFSAKVTRKGHARRGVVRVTVYRNGHALRTITAKRFGSRYGASWNLRTNSGALVAAGVYRYSVRAKTAVSGRGSTTGKVRVPVTRRVVVPPKPPTVSAPPTTTVVPTITPVVAPAPQPSRWVGFYAQGNFDTPANLDTLESLAGTRAAVVNIFVADAEGFPVNRAKTVADRGSIPMITLEFKSLAPKGGLDAILVRRCRKGPRFDRVDPPLPRDERQLVRVVRDSIWQHSR